MSILYVSVTPTTAYVCFRGTFSKFRHASLKKNQFVYMSRQYFVNNCQYLSNICQYSSQDDNFEESIVNRE